MGGADGKKVRWGTVTAPESDSSALFCLSLLPCLLIPFLTLSPPPPPPPPSRSLAHAIARSLFPQSDQGERSAWVASPSCCTLSTSTYCHSAAETLLGKTKIPRLCIRGKTQEKEKPAGEIDWGSLTELRSLCSSLAFDD